MRTLAYLTVLIFISGCSSTTCPKRPAFDDYNATVKQSLIYKDKLEILYDSCSK